MNRHRIADLGFRIDHHARINVAQLPDIDAFADHRPGLHPRSGADGALIAQNHPRSDNHALSESDVLSKDNAGVNCGRVRHMCKQLGGPREPKPRLPDFNH
jgi:hypothetical protein